MRFSMPLWARLAVLDISVRYRRSVFGPFWITITMLIFVVAVGTLYSGLLGLPTRQFLHFIAVGLVAWQFLAACLQEGCDTFITGKDFILNTQIKPYELVYRVVARNVIILAHNLPIILLTGYIAWPDIGLNIPMFGLGLLLLLANALWITIVLALLAVRYRDVSPMMTAIIQLLFILSPIIWSPSMLPEKTFFILLNPIYYLIEVVRSPLLAGGPNWTAYLVVSAMAVLGGLIAWALYKKTDHRIAYWA